MLILVGGVWSFWKRLNSGAFASLWENRPLVGNAATLVVCRNVCLTIIFALSESVTEFSAVVRTQ